MANIKSAKKRIVQSLKRTEVNRFRKSKIRSGIKKIHTLVAGKDLKEIGKNFLVVESELAKAVGKGVYKKNTASRLISRLSKKIRSAS
ncbi:MAG: 30S ribosomal protein S20 [Pelagibacteraceae bacterium TMED65]|nr:30S ribosomal protein S20 [Rickettsiales bacterium]OUU52036.1 MAG: 30S ribosomal protein S20 [Pelagibacteraceae bacterium TMED65]|tara:strand:- start:2 stop:265 length:264 start_codon:yes stop_codon:yes gene_type:complete